MLEKNTIFAENFKIMQENHSFIRRILVLGCSLSFIFCALMLTGCGNQNTKKDSSENTETEQVVEQVAEETEDNGVKAPAVQADTNGLIGLGQCSTVSDRLRVELSEDKNTAKIFLDGELLQTITDADDALVAAGDDAPIFFLDANFDGLTDIFIGPGESRTYSSLLIWEPESKQFRRIGHLGEPSLQNFLLCPETKNVYEGGSNSWCSSSFTKSVWEDGTLKAVEDVIVVSDPEQYGENEVSDKYTLKSSDGKTVKAVAESSQLPGKWADVLEYVGY